MLTVSLGSVVWLWRTSMCLCANGWIYRQLEAQGHELPLSNWLSLPLCREYWSIFDFVPQIWWRYLLSNCLWLVFVKVQLKSTSAIQPTLHIWQKMLSLSSSWNYLSFCLLSMKCSRQVVGNLVLFLCSFSDSQGCYKVIAVRDSSWELTFIWRACKASIVLSQLVAPSVLCELIWHDW